MKYDEEEFGVEWKEAWAVIARLDKGVAEMDETSCLVGGGGGESATAGMNSEGRTMDVPSFSYRKPHAAGSSKKLVV